MLDQNQIEQQFQIGGGLSFIRLCHTHRAGEADQQEAGRLLRRGEGLGGLAQTPAGRPPALEGHDDLPGRGRAAAPTRRHRQ